MKSFRLYLLIFFLVCVSGCRNAPSSQRTSSCYTENNSKREIIRERSSLKGNETINSKILDGKTIFRKYNSAVFMVFTSDGIKGYQGSGFFINNTGLALSNYHVFEGTSVGAEQIKLVDSDICYKVTDVIAKNKDYDFILFKVNVSQSNYIPLATEKPQVGEKVYTIGSPRGLENTFSSGEVSQWRDKYLMQISALIDHGSSGGALINENGYVVGITSGSFYDGSQANLNYAWSIDVIKPFLK